MGLRNIVLRQSNCIMSFFLQMQRLIELLTHVIPHCNILKFPSVNLQKTALRHYYSIYNLL